MCLTQYRMSFLRVHMVHMKNFYKIKQAKISFCVFYSIWWIVTRWTRTSGGFWTTLASTFCRRWTRTVSRWLARANATEVRADTTHVASTWIVTSRTISSRTTREDSRKRTRSKNGRPRYSSCCPVDSMVAPWWPAIRLTTLQIPVSTLYIVITLFRRTHRTIFFLFKSLHLINIDRSRKLWNNNYGLVKIQREKKYYLRRYDYLLRFATGLDLFQPTHPRIVLSDNF